MDPTRLTQQSGTERHDNISMLEPMAINHKVEGSSNRAQNKQINGFFFFHKQIIKNVVEKEVFK